MTSYRVTVDGRDYVVEISDLGRRPILATVDGETFRVEVEATGSAPVVAMPVLLAQNALLPDAPSAAARRVIPTASAPIAGAAVAAPLPGTIVTVSVSVGDTVRPGQELCVLEAMKMNNPIRSTRSGVVTEVLISVGQQVQHGHTLMLIAEA